MLDRWLYWNSQDCLNQRNWTSMCSLFIFRLPAFTLRSVKGVWYRACKIILLDDFGQRIHLSMPYWWYLNERIADDHCDLSDSKAFKYPSRVCEKALNGMDETKSYRRIIFDQQTCFSKLVYKNGVRESMEFGQGVPAACKSAGHYELEGILTFSFDNRERTSCTKDRFGVFTRPSYFIDWIRSEQISK